MTKFNTTKKNKIITLFSNKASSRKDVPALISDNIALSNGGTNYGNARISFPPDITFTGGAGSGALAIPNMINGTISSITLLNPGSGYTSAPTIGFVPKSTAKTTVLTALDGTLIDPKIISSGTGYYGTATVVISPPDTSGGTQAVGSATFLNGSVDTFSITTAGSGYTKEPTISITGSAPVGTGGVASVGVINNRVSTISIANAGSGYTNGADITIYPNQPGLGAGATATCTITTGAITAINIVSGGDDYEFGAYAVITPSTFSGGQLSLTIGEKVIGVSMDNAGGYYSTLPTAVVFSAPPVGTTATGTITASADGKSIDNIVITDSGNGYLVPPTISFTGGIEGGSGAIATCTLDPFKTFEYEFDIPPMELSKNAKISLIYVASTGSSATDVYTIRMKEISTHDTWDNTLGWPVLYSQLSLNMAQLNLSNVYHSLADINMNKITLSISEDIMNKNGGINSAINFVMQFRIFDDDYEEVDPRLMGNYTPVIVPPREVGMNRFY